MDPTIVQPSNSGQNDEPLTSDQPVVAAPPELPQEVIPLAPATATPSANRPGRVGMIVGPILIVLALIGMIIYWAVFK